MGCSLERMNILQSHELLAQRIRPTNLGGGGGKKLKFRKQCSNPISVCFEAELIQYSAITSPANSFLRPTTLYNKVVSQIIKRTMPILTLIFLADTLSWSVGGFSLVAVIRKTACHTTRSIGPTNHAPDLSSVDWLALKG